MYDVSVVFIECIRLREFWNYQQCGEWMPFSLAMMNRLDMQEYENSLAYKKF